jgi:broad specificity phosphatase PhoE
VNPELWLARHGETEWSRTGRHTSSTDLPLTPAGERAAHALRARLSGPAFDLVLTSPLRRAKQTARLAGFGDVAAEESDAHEWRYGAYEGLTSAQIRTSVPGWSIWTHPVPSGETAAEVSARADRIVERVRRERCERALLFGHGHLLRVLAARWVGQQAAFGANLLLDVATVSVLGWERDTSAIVRWNS